MKVVREFGMPGDHFGPGPWEGEPGRVEWTHNGTPCLMRRNHMGIWCGYAAVVPGHPLHGADYDTPNVDVHGGLTYAAGCDGAEGEGICHVPPEDQPGDVWWFGFDCGHGSDVIPTFDHSEWPGVAYRDAAYVRAETEALADQLAAVA